MKAVLDMNVVASGLFFGGVPRAILDLVADEAFELVPSPAILDEYQRIYARLATGHPQLKARHPYLDLLAYGTLVPDREVDFPITQDPDDDKFLVCARDAGAVVVSGDRHLLHASGWAGVQVLTPRAFLDRLTTRAA